jgi:hypothetical protein
MQHTTGVAVVATHLADTDRRALSQAWYSALHLADHAPTKRRTLIAPASRVAAAGGPSGPSDASPIRPNDEPVHARDVARNAESRRGGSADPGRRAARTELAQRIERALTRRPARAEASFAVRGPGGRVHLVVRTEGARTRVVAVCAPPLRERVERALAHARFALAGRGVRAEVA